MNKQELFNILKWTTLPKRVFNNSSECAVLADCISTPSTSTMKTKWLSLDTPDNVEYMDPTIEDTFYEQWVPWGHDEF